MATPRKSARESGERFFVRKRRKTAGILCVLQGFPNAFLAEKIRQNPQTYLCGIALYHPDDPGKYTDIFSSQKHHKLLLDDK